MNNIEIVSKDWYTALIEECEAIITETVFNARWELIQGYHRLGNRILEEKLNFEEGKIYGQGIVQHIAKSLGKSRRTIYYAIEFAEKYKDINTLPEGKNISWNKVCKLLSGSKDQGACDHKEWEEKIIRVCKVCGKHIKEGETHTE